MKFSERWLSPYRDRNSARNEYGRVSVEEEKRERTRQRKEGARRDGQKLDALYREIDYALENEGSILVREFMLEHEQYSGEINEEGAKRVLETIQGYAKNYNEHYNDVSVLEIFHKMIQHFQWEYEVTATTVDAAIEDNQSNCEGLTKAVVAVWEACPRLHQYPLYIQYFVDHMRAVCMIDNIPYAIERPSPYPLTPSDFEGTILAWPESLLYGILKKEDPSVNFIPLSPEKQQSLQKKHKVQITGSKSQYIFSQNPRVSFGGDGDGMTNNRRYKDISFEEGQRLVKEREKLLTRRQLLKIGLSATVSTAAVGALMLSYFPEKKKRTKRETRNFSSKEEYQAYLRRSLVVDKDGNMDSEGVKYVRFFSWQETLDGLMSKEERKVLQTKIEKNTNSLYSSILKPVGPNEGATEIFLYEIMQQMGVYDNDQSTLKGLEEEKQGNDAARLKYALAYFSEFSVVPDREVKIQVFDGGVRLLVKQVDRNRADFFGVWFAVDPPIPKKISSADLRGTVILSRDAFIREYINVPQQEHYIPLSGEVSGIEKVPTIQPTPQEPFSLTFKPKTKRGEKINIEKKTHPISLEEARRAATPTTIRYLSEDQADDFLAKIEARDQQSISRSVRFGRKEYVIKKKYLEDATVVDAMLSGSIRLTPFSQTLGEATSIPDGEYSEYGIQELEGAAVENVSIRGAFVTKEFILSLNRIRGIQNIQFEHCVFEEGTFEKISLPELQYLNLSDVHGVRTMKAFFGTPLKTVEFSKTESIDLTGLSKEEYLNGSLSIINDAALGNNAFIDTEKWKLIVKKDSRSP